MTRHHPTLRRATLWLATFTLIATSSWVVAEPYSQEFQRQRDQRAARADTTPVNRDCDALFSADQYNERIDCKTENANVALFDYVDTVLDFDFMRRSMGRGPIFTDAQMEQLMAGRERAQSAKNRSRDAKGFRGQVKRQKAEDEDCYTKEIIGDNRGDDVQPCVKGEDCEEVLDDGIGNDDGKCKLQGNNREVCIQVCQQPLPSEDENYDSDQAIDTEKGLDELEGSLMDATEQTKHAMERMQERYAEAMNRANECEMFQFDLAPTATALQVAQVAKNASGAAFNGCSVVCNQDAFGWNCEAACLAFAIIDGVLNGVNDALAIADGNNGSAQLDRVARCAEQLDDDIKTISAGVDANAAAINVLEDQLDDVQTALSDLMTQINMLTALMVERFDTVDGYLCVPQGQRECFPDGAPGSGGGGALRQR